MVQFSPSQVRSLAQNAENLLQHRPLLCALRLWARSCRLGNMATERLLSLVRRSAPNRCTVERVLGAGYLAQLETRHKSAGGACVRTLTRKQLFSIGAPIQASKGRPSKAKRAAGGRGKRPTPPFTAWANEQLGASRAKRGTRTVGDRSAYRAVLKDLKMRWLATGKPRACSGTLADTENVGWVASYEDRIGSKMWGCSTPESPLSTDLMEKCAAEVVVAPASRSRTLGLTESMEPARAAFVSGALVSDAGCHRLSELWWRHLVPLGFRDDTYKNIRLWSAHRCLP